MDLPNIQLSQPEYLTNSPTEIIREAQGDEDVNNRSPISLVAASNINTSYELRVGSGIELLRGKNNYQQSGIGTSYEFGDNFGATVTVTGASEDDKFLGSYKRYNPSLGKYESGIKEQIDLKETGVAIDFKFGGNKSFFTLGGNFGIYYGTERDTGNIIQKGNILESYQRSTPFSEFSCSLRLGLEKVSKSGYSFGLLAQIRPDKKQILLGGKIYAGATLN